MKIAYFDCPAGLSGNMILGALIEAGLDIDQLKKELKKLQTSNFKPQNKSQLLISKVKKHSIKGTHVDVIIKSKDKQRSLKDIITIIKSSKLSRPVKTLSSKIFKRLAAAEARVHGLPVNKVHFHEVGAIDAIIDIVGACIGIEKLGIQKIFCSPLPNGKGKIVHTHGLLPNPAPAAAELLRGVPTFGTGIKGELVTPTGAAIITTLAESFGDPPRLIVDKIGYGAGSLDLPIPNLLRLFIGEAQLPTEHDAILQIETNIDDMDPRAYDRAIAKIMRAGALDTSIYPIRMKKKRAAVKLEVLCRPEDKDKILAAVFENTSTIGARTYLVSREKLKRRIRRGIKYSYLDGRLLRAKPE